MGNGQAQALWRKRQTADGRRHIEGFILGLSAADKCRLSRRPRHRAIRMQRYIVDPAPLLIGCEVSHNALGVERCELTVIAAGDDALAVGRRAQDRTAVDRNARNLTCFVDQRRIFLSADEHGSIAEKMQRGCGHAAEKSCSAPQTGADEIVHRDREGAVDVRGLRQIGDIADVEIAKTDRARQRF